MEFDGEKRELIEAALEPLGQVPGEVRGTLEEAVAAGSLLTPPDEALTAAKRLRATAAGTVKRRQWRSAATLAGCLVALWFGVVGPGAREEIYRITLSSKLGVWLSYMSEKSPPRLPLASRPEFDSTMEDYLELVDEVAALAASGWKTWTPPARLPHGLGGATIEEWEAKHSEEPENAAIYSALARVTARDTKKLPQDFLAVGERLDPGNAWFRLSESTCLTLDAIQREKKHSDVWKLVDEEKSEAAWELLREASRMEKFDDYRLDLMGRQHLKWPQASDLPDRHFLQVLLFRDPSFEIPLHLDRTLNLSVPLLECRLDRLAVSAGVERVDDAARDFRELLSGFTEMKSGYGGREFLRGLAQAGGAKLSRIYAARGQSKEAASWAGLAAEMEKLAPVRSFRQTINLTSKGGAIARGFNEENSPWLLEEADLKPGRLAEYAMYERYLWHAACLLLAVAGLVALRLLPPRQRHVYGKLPERCGDLLTARETAVLMAVALLPPAIVYYGATRSIADWHDWFLSMQRFVTMALQFVAMALWVLIVTPALVRRFLMKRGAALGFHQRYFALAVLMGILSLAAIPASIVLPDILRAGGADDLGLAVLVGMLSLPLICLVVMILGKQGSAVRRLNWLTVARACAPVFAAGALLALVGIAVAHREERYWVARMDYEASWPERTALDSPAHRELAQKIGQAVSDWVKED